MKEYKITEFNSITINDLAADRWVVVPGITIGNRILMQRDAEGVDSSPSNGNFVDHLGFNYGSNRS